eukprot:3451578-Amphidinium_carterae.1
MVYIVNVHGPTENATVDEFTSFWMLVDEKLGKLPPGAKKILMGDFNVRFGTFEEGCGSPVGPFAVSTPKPSMRWRSEALVTLLRKHELFVTTTYHEGSACNTWRHARYWTTGHGAQIDHICACRFLTSKVRRSFMISSTQLATTVVSDHDMVCEEVAWLRTPTPKTEMRGKFLNDEHRQDFMEAYKAQPPSSGDEVQHAHQPFQAFQQWLVGVQALVSSTIPQLKRAAKKDWMTDRTWRLITQTATLAKRVTANYHRLSRATLAQSFYCWKWT